MSSYAPTPRAVPPWTPMGVGRPVQDGSAPLLLFLPPQLSGAQSG